MTTDTRFREDMRIDEVARIACLFRCDDCAVWWGQGCMPTRGNEHLVFRVLDPYQDQSRWENYRGWRTVAVEKNHCPDCGCMVEKPLFTLFDTTYCR
jgi:hypothetical protein